MRILDIVEATTVDGPGFRNSVYLAGCTHHCQGCHNPQSWDSAGGHEITPQELAGKLIDMGLDVTFSGGDPMLQAADVAVTAEILKSAGLSVWVYTGFSYEELTEHPDMNRVLDFADVVVDGRFVLALRNTSLLFRGSSNQRLIDVKASRRSGKVVKWKSSF